MRGGRLIAPLVNFVIFHVDLLGRRLKMRLAGREAYLTLVLPILLLDLRGYQRHLLVRQLLLLAAFSGLDSAVLLRFNGRVQVFVVWRRKMAGEELKLRLPDHLVVIVILLHGTGLRG